MTSNHYLFGTPDFTHELHMIPIYLPYESAYSTGRWLLTLFFKAMKNYTKLNNMHKPGNKRTYAYELSSNNNKPFSRLVK